jgi:formate dehydrogenase major subunit
MPKIYINGNAVDARPGATVLECAHSAGVDIPSLCADPRLKPYGGCRLCLVQIDGAEHPVAACTTAVRDGMTVTTHTPEIEKHRRTLLQLLARDYPAQAIAQSPHKAFHQLLQQYGVAASGAAEDAGHGDSHPYIQVEMSRCILCARCIRICEEVQGQFVWQAWNRGDATRIHAGLGTSLLESSCTSCGACVDTCPTGALEDRSLILGGAPTGWTRTVCPYCGAGCEVNAGTRDGRLVNIRPLLGATVNKGHLCAKGRYAFDYVHAPDRVLHPMIRKQGKWETVSWDEALQATARALHKAIQAHGPDSVGVLASARGTNEEAYLAQKFARVVLGTNNVDCCARVCHAPSAAALKQMLGTGAATNSFNDIERAATVLLCGCNPTENHPVVEARIKQAVLRGARLVVIDPRQTELSSLADVHLQIRPGTDIPALLAMAGAIVEENLFHPEFVTENIENWPAFQNFISQWPPESAAAICGVTADSIRAAARIYAAGPSISFHGLGLTEHVQGTEAVMCLVNLALLTGNLGKPGCGVNPLRGQNNVQGAAVMGCDPGALAGSAPLKQAAPVFQQAWQCDIPQTRGLDLLEMLDAAHQGRLKVLWAIGYDVLLTNANLSATREALRNMDAIIVQDLFLNETAREFGAIFLPACSSFEKDGTFMNAERRIQRVRAALPPAGESKPDWEIICNVARAMGKSDQFSFASPQEIWDEVRSVWPDAAGITYARLEQGGIQWPCPDERHSGTAILYQHGFPNRKTVRLHCPQFQPSPESTSSEFPFLLMTGRTLHQFNAGTMTGRTLQNALRPSDYLEVSPQDAEKLQLQDTDFALIRSHYGEVALPVQITTSVRQGQLFATFHRPDRQVNLLTGNSRDSQTNTPEYKVTAVSVEKVPQASTEKAA